MAQTGYTPILIYSSSTTTNAPAAGNLTNSTLGSELAINITDGKLFYKDNANNVQVIAWKTTPTTAGGTGLTSYTAGDLLYYATGTTLTKLGIGSSTNILTSSGTAPQWTAPSSITVGKATNLDGGAAGSVPYQSGAGATTFLGIGAANTVLTSSGTAPQWSASLTLTTLTATNSVLTANNSGIVGGTPPNNTLRFTDTDTTAAADQPIGRMEFYSSDTGNEGVKAYVEARATDGSPDGDLFFATHSNAGGGLIDRLRIRYDGDITALTGNLVIGTSGKGIDFSATAGTGTSELLADYEEGNWTPTDLSGATLSFVSALGKYTKIGNQVTAWGWVEYPSTASGLDNTIGGLPFNVANQTAVRGGFALGFSQTANAAGGILTPNTAYFVLVTSAGVNTTNAQLSTKIVSFAAIYQAA